MAAPARGWSALLLKALWIIVLQGVAVFSARYIFQKGWVNDQALIGLFMMAGGYFFWLLFPYSRMACTFLTCRDRDVMWLIAERYFEGGYPLIGVFGMALNVCGMAYGAVWFFQSFSLSPEEISENTPFMAVTALIFFVVACLGAMLLQVLGSHDEHSSSYAKHAIKRGERIILSSVATYLIHRVNQVGVFTNVFLAGGVMIFLSLGVIYVSLNRDLPAMLTESECNRYCKISVSIIWILLGIWFIILSLSKKLPNLDVYLIVIFSVFGIDFLIGIVPAKFFQLSVIPIKGFWRLFLFICNRLCGFDPDNGGADNGANNGVHV